MSLLVNKHEFGEHQRKLLCSGGLAVFVFTFTSYVGPRRKAIYAGASSPIGCLCWSINTSSASTSGSYCAVAALPSLFSPLQVMSAPAAKLFMPEHPLRSDVFAGQ